MRRLFFKPSFSRYNHKGKFVKRPLLHNDIKTNILSNIYGVHVLWSPFGSGKTSYLQKITDEFNSDENSGAKVIYTNGSNLINNSLENEIRNKLSISDNLFKGHLNDDLKQYAIKNLTLIIDDYDTFCYNSSYDHVYS